MAQSQTFAPASGSLWRRLTGLAYYPDDSMPRRRNELLAASVTVGKRKIRNLAPEAWQQEAMELYSEVGELRYVAVAEANTVAQARLFVGQWEVGNEEPAEVEAGLPLDVWNQFGGGALHRAELIKRLAVQLFVPGDGYIVGLPPGVMDERSAMPNGLVRLTDLTWHVMAASEVRVTRGELSIDLGDKPFKIPADSAVIIRAWRPNPFRWWQADSPVRSNLAVLRELVGLTKHVSASIDSRLAGAGLLLIGDSFSLMAGQSPDPDDDGTTDPILAALMDAMLTAIKDRDSASAVMPILLQGPDEAIDKVKHLTFDTPFDDRTKELRDEAIRRLALGLDAPAEVLLGMGTSTHWNAWLIQEDRIKTHTEPTLSLICDALTQDFLWPILQEQGVADYEQYVIWYDTGALTQKADRSREAMELYDRGELSGLALRREAGFDDDDAGEVDERRSFEIAVEFAKARPELLHKPGFGPLLEMLRAAMDGRPIPDLEFPEAPEPIVQVIEEAPPAEPDLPVEGPPETRDESREIAPDDSDVGP